MSNIVNITDKFSEDKCCIKIGEKEYPVENSLNSVLRFEELQGSGKGEDLIKAIEIALGPEAVAEIGVRKLSIKNFKTLTIGILAAMQEVTFEEASSRFQNAQPR